MYLNKVYNIKNREDILIWTEINCATYSGFTLKLYPPYYSGMIRTFISKYQKFMTYLLVYEI
jgi:hypothetical protein